MSNILLVPVHLDALVLDHDELVVNSTADFSRLPYRTDKRDINPDVANISEDIVSMPFENQLLLEAGIHLHWSLPDALTKARPKPGSPEIQEFPLVPNRWLVTRCTVDDRVEKEWIIESDYLNPPANASGIQTGVAIPYHEGEGQPFRYIGRKVDLSDAPQTATREQGAYYPMLTAVGYGEPTFAAFYPNCYSVFGFFEKFTGSSAGRRYYLTGWYSDPAKDVLKTHVKSLSALEEDFKWTITPTGQEFPSRIVCYARLDIDKPKLSQPNELGTIAVGNTGTEALSACMAKRLREKQQAPAGAGGDDLKAVYEDQFEAMHFVSRLEHRQLDVAPKLFEARHDQGFTAVTGGTLWTVRPESIASSAAQVDDASADITLPEEVGHLLNVVNEQQAKYERAWQEIESLRVQLFSDWYKYMLCSYPPNDLGDAYPDIDDVALYIEGHSNENLDTNLASVASLKRKLAYAGTLELSENNGKIRADKAKGELGVALAKAINELQTFIEVAQSKTGSNFRLKQVSGPRYWRPTEPAILIEGPVAKPSLRHGQDGRPGDGLLETELLTNVDAADPSRNDLRPKIREKIAEIGRTRKNFAFTKWEGQPWNPFLLEWQVEVFPIEHHSNIDPATGRYQEDFIVANYDLAENKVDLSLKRDKGATTKAANIYSGRSILTPHAMAQLTQQINTYIFKEVFPLYYKAKGSKANLLKAKATPMSRWGKDDLFKQIQEVEKWYMGDERSPLLSVQKPHEDTGLTAFRGREELQAPDVKSLSQSLGGFNDALLMHKQTPQLRIEDPLGFSDYQKFGERVKDVVNNSIYSAPEPLNDFNPIRSGTMKIHQLRLVDTFGQVKKLDVKKLVTSQPLTAANDSTLVTLPPRLVQPARVNFRWLAADRNEQEMNDHPATTPIFGWVLANHLDDSVMFYDNRGRALGSLVKKYGGPRPVVVWLPAPGGGGVSKVLDIANPHLKKLILAVQRWNTDFLDDFIAAIDSAVKNIEPENFAQHQDLALLMGRPLALVRASVNLEIKGLPASHQGWNEFRQNLDNKTRDDNGFSRVKFPIRIGEYRQFNDGTVGYWKEKNRGYEDEVFFAPQSDEDAKVVKSTHLKTHKTHPDDMVFYQTVEAEPQILSLLIDPRGSVHATTGILPVKEISIPPDQYAAALQAIEITFLSTPIITDAGKIHLPLPDEAGYQWSWLQQDAGGTWSEVSSRGLVRKEDFTVFGAAAVDVWNELVQKEWIKVIDEKDPTRASVTAKDERKSQSLDRHKDKTAKIEDILDRAHLGPTNLTAKFSGPQEIREGWLKLSAAEDVQRKPQT
jgi:hypothetical protein